MSWFELDEDRSKNVNSSCAGLFTPRTERQPSAPEIAMTKNSANVRSAASVFLNMGCPLDD
jgi:hypothetical protein